MTTDATVAASAAPIRGTYQLLPPLDVAELAALRESIATFGLLQPVIVDEAGEVLDGHHRVAICRELGLAYQTVTLPGLTAEQKIEQALALNLARRHLTPEQKRALVLELRGRGLSIRFISEKTGIPRSSVQRTASAVPDGTPEYVTGQDGKRYAAQRPGDAAGTVWRSAWCDAGVPATTTVELREVLGVEEDGADEPGLEIALVQLLTEHAAGVLITTGSLLPAPAHIAGMRSDEWSIRVQRAAGAFFRWCRSKGIRWRDGWELPECLDAATLGYWCCFLWVGIGPRARAESLLVYGPGAGAQLPGADREPAGAA